MAHFHLSDFIPNSPFLVEDLEGYILNPKEYVEKTAHEYISRKSSGIVSNFRDMKQTQLEYEKILANPPRKCVLAREIAEAVEKSGEKRVCVEILKRGKKHSFQTKIEALLPDYYTACRAVYRAWDEFVGEESQEFKRRF